jgi:signal transduction histidine kinase
MGVIEANPIAGPDVLTRTVDLLSTADSLARVTSVVARAVRELTGADGATFVLREDEQCYYVDESAVGPLWKGSRFPLTACVSGWSMLHRETVVIRDIYADDRVPHDAYRPTFVASLCMAPVRSSDPIGAVGAYWAIEHVPTPDQVRQLEVLANSAAVALENLELRGAIRRRSAERDRLAARANELEETMQTLVHDLRGPLGAMMGFAELLADGADGASAVTYAHAVMRAGERMSAQIERMLSIYRITSTRLAPQALDVTSLARCLADDLRVQHRDREIVVEVEEGLRATADPALTQLLLDNLLGNAVKYTGHRPVAHIRVRAVAGEAGMHAFEVSDDGDGFAQDDAGRLFRPLVRLHAHDEFPGTGLGLASVARIVQLHGGSVSARGVKGEGAAFTFSLPA